MNIDAVSLCNLDGQTLPDIFLEAWHIEGHFIVACWQLGQCVIARGGSSRLIDRTGFDGCGLESTRRQSQLCGIANGSGDGSTVTLRENKGGREKEDNGWTRPPPISNGGPKHIIEIYTRKETHGGC